MWLARLLRGAFSATEETRPPEELDDIKEETETVSTASAIGKVTERSGLLRGAFSATEETRPPEELDDIKEETETVSTASVDVVTEEKNIRFNLDQRPKITTPINGIVIPLNNFNIGNIDLGSKKLIEVEIHNVGTSVQQFLKCTQNTNLTHYAKLIEEKFNVPIRPNQSKRLTFEIFPRTPGYWDEHITFKFAGFAIKRVFQMKVTDPKWTDHYTNIKSNTENAHHLLPSKKTNYDNSEDYVPGEKMLKAPLFIKLRAPSYPIPSKVMDFYLNAIEDESYPIPPKFELLSTLDKKTYSEKFHHLLYFEELAMDSMYMNFNFERTILLKESEYLVLDVKDLQQKRPSIQYGDTVRVKILSAKESWKCNSTYEGCIHKISINSLYIKFSHSFHVIYNGEDVSVVFHHPRTTFKKLHLAVDLASCNLTELVFPEKLYTKENQVGIEKVSNIKWFNPDLNCVQETAVINILKGNTRPMPYVIFGPPGTGKTVTLVETIMQLFTLMPKSYLLVATPSNSSATLLLERLVKTGRFRPNNIVHLVGYNYATDGDIPKNLRKFCSTLSLAEENSSRSTYFIDEDGLRFNSCKSKIDKHRICIGTCNTLGTLPIMGFPCGHFTHVLVDEAGQCTEPEVMIPLTLINRSGQIVLCGDPLQLGPVVISQIAKKHGLGLSYLERILNSTAYKSTGNDYNPNLVTKLIYNYRAVQDVLEITNKIFYNDTLLSMMNKSVTRVSNYMNMLGDMFKYKNYPAILFHGVRGTSLRHEGNPSWFNHDEATMVVSLLIKLYSSDIPPEDIGIITPYFQQARHILHLIDRHDVPAPKVGSVEDFQGQERKIVILSTVRSTRRHMQSDVKCDFINDRKRVNVAMSRAQFLMVIYGNPYVLAADPLWRSILQQIVLNRGYMGCDQPKEIISC